MKEYVCKLEKIIYSKSSIKKDGEMFFTRQQFPEIKVIARTKKEAYKRVHKLINAGINTSNEITSIEETKDKVIPKIGPDFLLRSGTFCY